MTAPTPDTLVISASSVGDWLPAATNSLRAVGIDTPDFDARLLLADATGLSPGALIAHRGRVLEADERKRLERHVIRRLAREPVSRILGAAEFYGRRFRITPATLDPRPDSETLIDAALEIVDEQGWRKRPLRILDVGTGCGCLLLTLLAELPYATGLGTDINAAALEVAGDNASSLGLSARAAFIEAQSLYGIDGPFDLLVTNPPYIRHCDIAALAPEVSRHDPHTALDGGADGLDVYREIAGLISNVIPKSWALFEIGAGQAAALSDILMNAGHGEIGGGLRLWRDLGGIERVVATQTHDLWI